MARAAKRTDPESWDEVKQEVSDSDRGGRKGRWSAPRRNSPCRNTRAAAVVTRTSRRAGRVRGGFGGSNRSPWSMSDLADVRPPSRRRLHALRVAPMQGTSGQSRKRHGAIFDMTNCFAQVAIADRRHLLYFLGNLVG